jgi:hypothetical protein
MSAICGCRSRSFLEKSSFRHPSAAEAIKRGSNRCFSSFTPQTTIPQCRITSLDSQVSSNSQLRPTSAKIHSSTSRTSWLESSGAPDRYIFSYASVLQGLMPGKNVNRSCFDVSQMRLSPYVLSPHAARPP